MVQSRTVSIIFLITYSAFTIFIISYAYYVWQLEIGNWIQLFLLLVAIGVSMLEGLGQLIKALSEPRLKIENPRVEAHNINTKDEFKRILFDLKNNGKTEARGCKLKVKVKGLWDEFVALNPSFPRTIETFDLSPEDRCTIYLCEINKKNPTTTVIYILDLSKHSALTEGTHQLELRLFGKNFVDKKLHKLTLNLSSWEKIGIALE